MWKLQPPPTHPLEKCHLPFSQQPHSKSWGPVKPPPFWKFGWSPPPPPPQQKGISLKRANPRKSEVSFNNFFRSCHLSIASNLLKMSLRKTSLFVHNLTGVIEKYFVSCIFQTAVVITVIKILEQYLWRNSVLERNF